LDGQAALNGHRPYFYLLDVCCLGITYLLVFLKVAHYFLEPLVLLLLQLSYCCGLHSRCVALMCGYWYWMLTCILGAISVVVLPSVLLATLLGRHVEVKDYILLDEFLNGNVLVVTLVDRGDLLGVT
jgi:hypothetical protein